ncbi:MAG TPA: inorganic phosphate transporter [Bacteroidales bacterium]|jgi:phosphate/sulfate permease|nr:inorganic phosphate transporter [Bacteroidales bacterium]OQB64868.1 MAG: Sulfate permease CysP [Bacteroidetes bacterium ADurb.Bin145]NMD02988.1 inorganic phosphate transporter [Bacteroidales bacterium]HOU02026.1 inorganic phosphate transporter [Bacteroidales bacterium]HQG64047.1 inorganic phosphate transporter [Bacteroidales bacterium]
MILFFLTSGLFLGWSLGANDASNVFGTAVGSKMLSFRKAAIIASVAVIVGAVIQGAGASQTLGKLGSVNAIGGSFTLSLAAAVTVYTMTKFSVPVSSTQAIVGAIIGWNFFTGNKTDSATLIKIVSTWITGPIIGAIFAILLYLLVRWIKRTANIHLIRFESFIRTGLIIVGAFGAYSLGANNIANVMGVFVPAFNLQELDLGIFSLSSAQQLFLIGGLAIAVGIITYSKRVMETVGSNIIEISAEAALVVVLAHSLVLFIFSSTALSDLLLKAGLPRIPMVPVSSTQVIVGCIVGIGLYKGVRNINFRLLGEIALGWITTPVIAGLLSYFSLFFMKNIFNIQTGYKNTDSNASNAILTTPDESISLIFRYLLIGLIIIGALLIIFYTLLERKKTREMRISEEKFWKNIK